MKPVENPSIDLAAVLDRQDGIYYCVKDRNSVFLWVNQNFADLVGMTKDELIGHVDSRGAHVEDDKRAIASGKPMLNLHESIPAVMGDGSMANMSIVTQKGLLRDEAGEITGITVCFALAADLANAEYLINKLGLMPAAVGGHIALTEGSAETISADCLPPGFEGPHRLYSRNYYMLRGDEVLALHQLEQDEQWFHHRGASIRLHVFPDDANYWTVVVGSQLDADEYLQGLAPANHWFGGELVTPGTYSLCSCSVAPGFEATDPTMPTAADVADLKQRFPDQAAIIDRLAATVAPTAS